MEFAKAGPDSTLLPRMGITPATGHSIVATLTRIATVERSTGFPEGNSAGQGEGRTTNTRSHDANQPTPNEQWAVGSGQWAVGSGQWAVGSGQWAVGDGRTKSGLAEVRPAAAT
jgi:hypothetical protein